MGFSSQIGQAYTLLCGTVTQVIIGDEEAEVTVEVAPGIEITSAVSRTDALQFRSAIGQSATALVESVDVMLAVE
jgi:molybdopterin-binding protein